MPTLTDEWKTVRKDKRTEQHWKNIEKDRELNSYAKYQQKYNFIETDYGERPSNNGSDIVNPGFAFTTNLAKYVKLETEDECERRSV